MKKIPGILFPWIAIYIAVFLIAIGAFFNVAFGQNTWVNFKVQYDFYGVQESNFFMVNDSSGQQVFYHQPTVSYEYLDTTIQLSSGNYTVSLTDNYGDGWTSNLPSWFKMENTCQGMMIDWQLQGVSFFLRDTTINLLPCPPPYGGCTDSLAINYDSIAGWDDGSCIYPPCTGLDTFYVLNYCQGAQNKVHYKWTNMPNPSCRMAYYTRTTDPNTLGNVWYPYPTNWSNTGVIFSNSQNNTTYYFLGMLADSSLTDTLVVTTTECIPGCMDPTALNYNPWANVNNGSCQMPPANCSAGESNIVVTVIPDTYPGETSWEIADTTGTVLAASSSFTQVGIPVVNEVCIPNGTVIEFTMFDSFGDGLCGSCYGGVDGTVLVQTLCGDTIYSLLPGNANFGTDTSTIYTVAPCTPNIIYGCTTPGFTEYNPQATVDDSSCSTPVIIGCIDSTSPDYDSLANTMSIIPQCQYTLIITDEAEDGWFGSWLGILQDTIALGPFQMGPNDGYSQSFTINLSAMSPVEVMFFAPGNAATTASQCGFYLIGPEGDTTISGGTNAWTDPILQFPYRYNGVPYCGDYCTEGVFGCMDSTALNYNLAANMPDVCIAKVFGCTNTLAFNYDSLANVDDGSCVAIVIGCMDSTAFNFNPSANTNDSSACVPVIYGCMDDTMFNYSPAANTSDSSCIPIVFGCTDASAFNYDSLANTNNGSCVPIILGCTDITAFNYNPIANTLDSSCVPIIYGCIDAMMFNFNPLANTDNGSCIPYLYGCIDSTMWNYDPFANTDNGTCIPYIYGCTNPVAFNYCDTCNTDDGSCIPILYGCMDSTAFNYDPLANVDNGSCIPIIYGCTNPIALNYCDSCNTDDFSCILPIYGCTDSTMFNYNPLANVDNNSCVPYIYGCTDPSMLNYNPSANTEDFSCIPFIYGCTDSTALNYDSTANTDNGSCVAVVEGCMDGTAYNYDITANVNDSASCLYDAGCITGAGNPYWLNDDCYAWVIQVDPYCCENEWDNICQLTYNHCIDGWPQGADLKTREDLILLYPNPTGGLVITNNIIDAKVYNILGDLILEVKESNKIDLSTYNKGIYNIMINYNGKISNHKIIKQ